MVATSSENFTFTAMAGSKVARFQIRVRTIPQRYRLPTTNVSNTYTRQDEPWISEGKAFIILWSFHTRFTRVTDSFIWSLSLVNYCKFDFFWKFISTLEKSLQISYIHASVQGQRYLSTTEVKKLRSDVTDTARDSIMDETGTWRHLMQNQLKLKILTLLINTWCKKTNLFYHDFF